MKLAPKNIALWLVRHLPFVEAPFERWNFRRVILGGETMKVRAQLAARFVRGDGLEIGALHLPLPLPDGARARYVDSLTVVQARQHYPELGFLKLVPVSIVGNGEVLPGVPDESLDFLVANHVVEHCQNPLGTLRLWLDKLRPGGILFCAVPDARFTFDRERPLTTLEHLWRDFEEGPQGSYEDHLREWARYFDKVDEADVETRVAKLKESGYSIHFHVWDFATLEALLGSLRALGWPLKIETLVRNDQENIFVLRKVVEQSPSDSLASISVVIPTYNSGARLRQTLDSALDQTLAPLEIIVVDDGSSDGTPDFIRAHYGERVTLIEQRNGGVARARNAGWRLARGEWIAFLDHDDLWYPDKLKSLLGADDGSGVIYGRWREVNDAGKPLAETEQLTRQHWWHGARGRVFGWLFGWRCPLVSMSVPLVRRELLACVGGFDPLCVPCDDWDLWLRLARLTRFAFVDDVLLDYRCYPAQQSRDERAALRAAHRVLGKHPFALATRPLLLWWWLWLGAFGASLDAYNAAKAAPSRGALAVAMMRAVRAHPLALLSPAWVKLVARKIVKGA